MFREERELLRLAIKALKKYLGESQTRLEGDLMANYQLNAGDVVVITLTDTDDVTGAVVTPDPGSVTATLSSSSDTVSVSYPSVTITAGSTPSTGNTVTVDATVGGAASTPWVGTYDVVEATADPTTLTGVFGAESDLSPTSGTSDVVPEGFVRNEVTGGLDHV